MEVSKVSIQNILGTRLDVSFHRNKFSFESKIFPLKELRDLVDINPPVNLAHLRKEDLISFIPMEVVDENNGVIIKALSKRVMESKGYTKFQNGDLLWAKITPCMQNGKSAIACNLQNGVGCGSTEFFVLRPKNHEVLIEYIHYLMRDQRFLDAAMNSFGGNAGQQRVAKSYIEKVNIPFPPLYVQQRIVDIYNKAKREKQEKEEESQRLLDEIDTYLLAQLGIELPKEQQIELTFKVKASALIGGRYNPFSYSAKTAMLQELITSSPIKKKRVNEMLVLSSAGDWGIDEDEADGNDFVRCLVIRSTEFDNQYNLNLDSSRVKYRMVKRDKLEKMDLQEGDILVEKSGGSEDQPVGRVALLTSDVLQESTLGYSNFIHKIRLDKAQVNPEYAFYFLRTMYRIGMTESMQSQTNGIRNLSMPSFLKQYLLLPDNQEEITEQINHKYAQARKNQEQAKRIILEAKEQIERIILSKI